MKTPLKFGEVVNLYRWLCRKQINLEIIPDDVLQEFKQTRQYEIYLKRFAN